jgi:predicted nucleotidyltransferase component of viral defense system
MTESKTSPLSFAEVRRLVIIAMFADDTLMERLVLKGGNAVSLVHGIGHRSSLDIDLSLEDDFEDFEDAGRRLVHSLEDRVDSAGYRVFEAGIRPRPANRAGRPETWGGYTVEFKLIANDRAARLGASEAQRRQALVIGPAHKRTFRVEISKYEYCAAKQETELDGYTIYVYPPAMIVVEKIRAICQQMPEYLLVRNKRARARDFYDIHSIITERHVDLGSTHCKSLVEHVFAVKDVSLALIPRIAESRELHRPDWPAVVNSVEGSLESYDFYFDWLVAEIGKLEPLWEK